MPSYKTNDPKGWCGDPTRGAALGRPNIHNKEYTGKLTLRRIRLNSGGYDSNGTYFGWGASADGSVDFITRAPHARGSVNTRASVKAMIQLDYPHARFNR